MSKTPLRIKKQLVKEIQAIHKERGYMQKDLAKRMDTTPQRVSHLMANRAELFRIETLIGWLNRLGRKVSVEVNK